MPVGGPAAAKRDKNCTKIVLKFDVNYGMHLGTKKNRKIGADRKQNGGKRMSKWSSSRSDSEQQGQMQNMQKANSVNPMGPKKQKVKRPGLPNLLEGGGKGFKGFLIGVANSFYKIFFITRRFCK